MAAAAAMHRRCALQDAALVNQTIFGEPGSRLGTEIAATFYTLLAMAKLVGIDPAKYLRAAAIADRQGTVLLPHEFQAEG